MFFLRCELGEAVSCQAASLKFFLALASAGAGREGRRGLCYDRRRDVAVLPDQAGVVLHAVPTHPRACTEDDRSAAQSTAQEAAAEGREDGGACGRVSTSGRTKTLAVGDVEKYITSLMSFGWQDL